MSEDYQSGARGLALPTNEPRALRHSGSPLWTRRQHNERNDDYVATSYRERISVKVAKLQRQAYGIYRKLSVLQLILLAMAALASFVLSVLFLVYNERIFGWLAPIAQKWRDLPAGWLILFTATFVVSFPPLIGYSSCVTLAGFVYGFPNGWFIVAVATVLGSTTSFVVCRTILANYVKRMVEKDKRFAALSLTLKHDGLKLLCMIRLCPLPYSLSNGAMASFPTVQWTSFMLASAIASPKLLIHVFIGSRLAAIARSGEKMDAKTRAINYLGIGIGMVAGAATGWLIWSKTQARARELEAEEEQGGSLSSGPRLARQYSDRPGESDGTVPDNNDNNSHEEAGDDYWDLESDDGDEESRLKPQAAP